VRYLIGANVAIRQGYAKSGSFSARPAIIASVFTIGYIDPVELQQKEGEFMAGLKTKEDAYGQEIYAYWRGDTRIIEAVERDDGYLAFSSGPRSYFIDYPDWPKHQRQAIRFARGRILDIGCGAGRCLLYLKKKGLEVVGIDTSPLAVKVCRERGLSDVHVRSITQIGPYMGTFDTIIMMGNNFGLFGSFNRARRLLRTMHRMTTPRARIIAESMGPDATDVPEHKAYHRRNRRRGRMPGQSRIRIRFRTCISPWFDHLFVSVNEMRAILDGTGWRIARLFPCDGPFYCAVIEKESV
jgi:SAM-dependent methyltransferase